MDLIRPKAAPSRLALVVRKSAPAGSGSRRLEMSREERRKRERHQTAMLTDFSKAGSKVILPPQIRR
jgi:hypothetical protein